MSEPEDRRENAPADGARSEDAHDESRPGTGPATGPEDVDPPTMPPWDPTAAPTGSSGPVDAPRAPGGSPAAPGPPTGGWQSPGGPPPGQGPPPGGWQSPGAPPPGQGPPAGWQAPPGAPPPGQAPQPPGYGGYDPWGFGGPLAAPRPGIIPLRPLALGELLDGAFQNIRTHPRVVLGIAAVVAVVSTLIQVPFQVLLGRSAATLSEPGATPDLDEIVPALSGAASLGGVSVVVGVLANTVLTGLLIVIISRAVLGAPVDGGDCWRAARPRLPGLLGVVVLVGLITVVVMIVCLLPAGAVLLAGSRGGALALAVLGFLAAIVVAVAISTYLTLAAPAYVLEHSGVVAALRRSRDLVRGRFWPVLGITLLAGVIVSIVSGIITIPFSVASGAIGAATSDPGGLLPVLVGDLGTIIGLTLAAPFQAGVTGLLYVDQRMRREGFDIELQRAAHGRA